MYNIKLSFNIIRGFKQLFFKNLSRSSNVRDFLQGPIFPPKIKFLENLNMLLLFFKMKLAKH